MLISSALSFTWMWSEASNMTMTWSYPLLVAPCVYYCLVVKRSIIIFLASVAGLITYTQLVTAYLVNDSTYGVFDVGVEHAVVTAAVAFVLMLIGKRMSELPCESSLVDYGISLRLWAARLGIAVLFVMSFEATWLGLLSSRAFVLACLASVVLAQSYSFYKALKEGRGLPVFELIYSGAFAFCTLALLIGERTGGGVALVLLIQLLIVGTGASLIYQGAKATQHSKVVTGTLVLLMFAFIRYIDLFGNYIGASLLFMLEGVILYAVASRLRKQTNLIEE